MKGFTSLVQPPRRRRGYLLIELITVVALLAVFTVIIGSTFAAAYRAQVDSERRAQRDHEVDTAMALLRRDTWNAARIEATANGITLTDSGGNAVVWTWADGWTREVRNSTGSGGEGGGAAEMASTMHFTGLPTENVGVEIRGPSLLLHFGGKTTPEESIAFTSQVARGGRQ